MGIFDLFKPNVKKLEAKKDVKGLIKALNYKKNWYVRERAAWALGEIGDTRAVEPLIHALKDYHSSVQRSALYALGEIGDARAVEPLIQALNDENRYSERRGILCTLNKLGQKPIDDTEKAHYLIAEGEWNELVRLGEPAVKPLVQALKDEYSDVRKEAAKALGDIGDEKAVEALAQAMKDEDSDVRWEAAEALGKIGDTRAVEPLIQNLNDEQCPSRKKAAKVLGEIGDKRAVEPLIQALNRDEYIRTGAAEALGKIGDARAVEPLIQALKDEDIYVRKSAAEALGKIGDKRAVEPLIQNLNDVRWEAAEALGKIGDKRAVEPLIQALKGVETYIGGPSEFELHSYGRYCVRREIVEALAEIGEPAVEPLIQAMRDDRDEYIRKGAAEALGGIGDHLDHLYQHLRSIQPERHEDIAIIQDALREKSKMELQAKQETKMGCFGQYDRTSEYCENCRSRVDCRAASIK